MTRAQRIDILNRALESRILILDGAMGTAIQAKNLKAQDFGGPALEGCNEVLVLQKPDLIQGIHEEYLAAGCDIVETNTFGGTPVVLDEYGISDKAYEINFAAAQIARRATDRFTSDNHIKFVAGAMGPTTKAISVTGGITFEALVENFYTQAKALFEGGVDYFLLETCQDTRNVKAALIGIQRLFDEKGEHIPVAVSATIEPTGTMLAGQSIEALLTSLSHLDLLYLGLNCATGPEFMTDSIRSLAAISPFRVSCVPNAGLPDENGCYLETPEMVSNILSRFIQNKWLNVIGGCCGTHAGHISSLKKSIEGVLPRKPTPINRSLLSGIDFLEINQETRPIIVGERTNVIGSKKFKELICAEKFEEASDIARAQIKNGAHIIDICLSNPDRDEIEDVRKFMEFAAKKIRAPLMIDSTDEKVIELALTFSQGKAIINSINLEDGEERYKKVIPLAKKFGAAFVVGTIDDDPKQGMGISRTRKLEIADRSYSLLTKQYKVQPEDIYWDPLVFPCATGDAQYVGSAVETIEGIRLLKSKYPNTKTVLGISNVSFGLPTAGREILNSVFLYHCVQAGLDLAIVNAEKLVRFNQIPEEEKKLSDDLLWNRGSDPIAAFAAHFRNKKGLVQEKKKSLPLEERLPRYIVEGSKDGLLEDLKEALKTQKPLEIINGPLMKGMDEVGRLFNKNELIVAEVLQSAEAMKAAVTFLEPFMEKSESSSRGKVLLATVKGDVHDIGKNLVEIILANNGFQVLNLGIKIPPEQLIQAIREHKPDIVGLSGLLVKSAQQMVLTAEDFSKAGITTPVLVGGAALSSNFVDKWIAKSYSGTVAYASDAMSGLELAKRIVDPKSFEALKSELDKKRNSTDAKTKETSPPPPVESILRSTQVEILSNSPSPPDFNRHVIKNTPIDRIWKYINPLMLYGRHLGIRGGTVRLLEKSSHDKNLEHELEQKEPKALSIWRAVEEVKKEYRDTEIMQPQAIYRFFKCSSEGNRLHLYDSTAQANSPLVTFDFPRQRKENGLCLSDYVSPQKSSPSTDADNLALFIVTAGKGVRQMAEYLKNRGDYLKSHILQALALESAEGYAELLHSEIRKIWGFPDTPETTMLERFQAKYRGKRYSFGYPACPRLDDQTLLFKLLSPSDIGVHLTDGFMMDPEASVSAIVFHHPQAQYFSVGHKGGPDDENR